MDVTQRCYRSQAAEDNQLAMSSAAGIAVAKMKGISVARSVAEECNVLLRE
jgi:uncharacterized protein YfiM (DUF2279 family)